MHESLQASNGPKPTCAGPARPRRRHSPTSARASGARWAQACVCIDPRRPEVKCITCWLATARGSVPRSLRHRGVRHRGSPMRALMLTFGRSPCMERKTRNLVCGAQAAPRFWCRCVHLCTHVPLRTSAEVSETANAMSPMCAVMLRMSWRLLKIFLTPKCHQHVDTGSFLTSPNLSRSRSSPCS